MSKTNDYKLMLVDAQGQLVADWPLEDSRALHDDFAQMKLVIDITGALEKSTAKFRTAGGARIQTAQFLKAVDLVPGGWDWLWEALATDGSFSWGENRHSLVRASDFCDAVRTAFQELEACANAADEDVEVAKADAFIRVLEGLGDTLIDLEGHIDDE